MSFQLLLMISCLCASTYAESELGTEMDSMHRTMLRANREANGSRHRRLKRGTAAILAEAEKMMNFQPSAKGSKLAKSSEGLSEPSTTVSVMIPKSGKGTTEMMPELLMSMPMALGKSGKMGKADTKAAKAMMPAMSMSMLMPMMAGKSGKRGKAMVAEMSMPMALGKSGKMGKADSKAAKAMMPAMSMSMSTLVPMMAGKSGKMGKAMVAEMSMPMALGKSGKMGKADAKAAKAMMPAMSMSMLMPMMAGKSGKMSKAIVAEMPMALGKSGKMGKADTKAAKAMMPAMSMSMLMPMMAGKSGKMSKGMTSIETPVTTVEPDAAVSTSQMSSSTSSANTKSSSLTVLPLSPEPEKTQPTPLSMAAQAAASLQHTDSHQPTVSWPTWSPALTAWPTYFPTSSPNSK